MQKVTCCQPPKLVSFTVLLQQDTFCQVLYEWTSLVFVDEHSVTFLSVCRKLTGLTLSAFVAGCLLSNTVWMASLVLADEHSVTFLSLCRKLAGLTLGLNSICVFTHAWPIEVCPLKSAVKADLSTGSVSQDPTWHPAVQFSSYQGVIF